MDEDSVERLLEECRECTGYGNDWSEDEDGELISRCTDCFVQKKIEELIN